MEAEGAAAPAAWPPRVRFGDHLPVVGVLMTSVLQLLVYLVYLPVAVVIAPWLRSRMRRYFERNVPSTVDPVVGEIDVPPGSRVFVVAGEASGDRLAARVVSAIRELAPDVEVEGYGSDACREAGMTIHRDLTANAVIGVGAVIGSLGYWWRVCVETLAWFRTRPPDVLLTVDFPGLNVCLARWARKRGIRTVHLVAPQLWAHAPWRVVRWRRAVDHLLCTMPFEESWFERTGIRTTYVGHPLFEAPLPEPRTTGTYPDAAPVVELLPGSRRGEIQGTVPMLVNAARLIADRLGADTRFVVRLAERRHREWFDPVLERVRCAGDPELAIEVGPARRYNGALLGALATSGTVTAELAVGLVPLVTFYPVSLFLRVVAYIFFVTPWFCLANLVAGRIVVPERPFFTKRAAEPIARAFLAQIDDPDTWLATRRALQVVRERLASPNVALRAARFTLAELDPTPVRSDATAG